MTDTMRPETAHQAQILRLLRDSGPRARAELADLVGLSRTKVLADIERLAELQLVEEGGLAQSRGGRRSSIVRLAGGLRFAGVDIGATSVDVAVTDGELRVLGHESRAVDVREGPVHVLDHVVDLVDTLREKGVFGGLTGAGVGVPGPVRVRDGTPISPPIMPGWDHYPVRDVLAQKLGCPAVVDNDVNLMAMGEHQSGTARGVDDFLFVKVGTGIGAGIVVGGEVYRGVTGSAGDIGHIQIDEFGPVCACGNAGCLEALVGGAALAREAAAAARLGRSAWLARRLEDAGELTAEDVGHAAAAGDPAAVEMIRDAGRRLGDVLASLVSFFNPALIVIGGGVAGVGHALLAEVRSVVYRRSAPLATGNLPIVLSELAGDAGVVGGVRLASDAILAVG